MKLSIVIPVHNEKAFLARVVDSVFQVDLGDVDREVIVVDDASTDGSRELLQALAETHSTSEQSVKGLYHEANLGKGAAVRTGLSHATGDWILIQDADLEYDPVHIPELLAPITTGDADVVYGSRFSGNRGRTTTRWHLIGNRTLTHLSNLLSGLRLTDMETGYKVFRREVAEAIQTREKRFGFEPEFTAKVARRGYRVVEVPIDYKGRSYQEGKKIRILDGLRAVYCVARYSLLP